MHPEQDHGRLEPLGGMINLRTWCTGSEEENT